MKTPAPCIECEDGTLQNVREDYEVITADGNAIVVPKVELIRCDHCDLLLVPAASSLKISEFQAEASEQLTQEQLHSIFERSDLTQKDFAEALGLGEKTFHRWLKGTQVISRSMGYYLRAVDHFPEAFAWVKDRKWREPAPKPARRTTDTASLFPALQRRSARFSHRPTKNPAKVLVLEATQ